MLIDLFLWWGVATGFQAGAAWLFTKASYDAWGEGNLDKRVFWSGFLAGCAATWFLRGPL